MNFDLTDDQAMMKETLDRLLSERANFETRLKLTQSGEGWDRKLWTQFAELGVLSLPFTEEHGGLGGGGVETMVVCEALGRALTLSPFTPGVVMVAAALRSIDALRASELAEAIGSGAHIIAFAHEEAHTSDAAFGVETRAERTSDGWSLTGTKLAAPFADSADALIVTARISGKGAHDDVGVFLINAEAAGLSRRKLMAFDGAPGADIVLDNVRVDETAALHADGGGAELLERLLQAAIAANAAEAVGVMQMLIDATAEHLHTRKQFGVTLGSFQALQHKAAEMLVAIEQARSTAMYAAMMVDEPDALVRRKAFAAIKAETGRTGRFVGQTAVQLHGGLGVSEEHFVGWGLKRLTMLDLAYGDAESAVAELAALGGLVET